ncbi:MAG: hypothetical protein FWH33_07650 [Oscillospiraceae bacterium]|nr:hypothetical protein [Oscillospiraceae bacterium]
MLFGAFEASAVAAATVDTPVASAVAAASPAVLVVGTPVAAPIAAAAVVAALVGTPVAAATVAAAAVGTPVAAAVPAVPVVGTPVAAASPAVLNRSLSRIRSKNRLPHSNERRISNKTLQSPHSENEINTLVPDGCTTPTKNKIFFSPSGTNTARSAARSVAA